MRRVHLLLPLALLGLLAIDAPSALGRGGRAAANRGTPAQTLSRFKRAFARNDYQGEWDTLSPGFKRRINKAAGRNVDPGDYAAMREKHRTDPRMRELRQWLPSARLSSIRYVKNRPGYANVSIRFGAPILLGRNISARMVNHELWELFVKGEQQPYWAFTDDKKMRVFRTRTENNYVEQSLDDKGKVTWQKVFKQTQIRSYRVATRWYFDGFGTLEDEFMGKLR